MSTVLAASSIVKTFEEGSQRVEMAHMTSARLDGSTSSSTAT